MQRVLGWPTGILPMDHGVIADLAGGQTEPVAPAWSFRHDASGNTGPFSRMSVRFLNFRANYSIRFADPLLPTLDHPVPSASDSQSVHRCQCQFKVIRLCRPGSGDVLHAVVLPSQYNA